jgi:hypothetical protein
MHLYSYVLFLYSRVLTINVKQNAIIPRYLFHVLVPTLLLLPYPAYASDVNLSGLFLLTFKNHHGVVYYNLTMKRINATSGSVIGTTYSKYIKGSFTSITEGDVTGDIDFVNNTLALQETNLHDPTDYKASGHNSKGFPLVIQAVLTPDGFSTRGTAPDGTISHADYHKATDRDIQQALVALHP